MGGQFQKPMRAMGVVGGLAFTLGAMVVLGALVGYYLDRRWGTSPWLTLAGTLLGTAAGFYEVVSVLRLIGEKE